MNREQLIKDNFSFLFEEKLLNELNQSNGLLSKEENIKRHEKNKFINCINRFFEYNM